MREKQSKTQNIYTEAKPPTLNPIRGYYDDGLDINIITHFVGCGRGCETGVHVA